ncbi:MAG: DUF2877 domain-containing protein, partial [Nocardioides sp.]|nr:DUF2877 domain-containing protein [Nocardioides sp.]
MPWAIVTDELPGVALADLQHGDPAAVAELLGRGGGLTPLGDDVLFGWIATACAVGRDERAAVSDEVARRSTRTTTLS